MWWRREQLMVSVRKNKADRMDISALPNNNHPEKLLQLDINTLPTSRIGAALSSQRYWQNRVYTQQEGRWRTETRSPRSPDDVEFVDRYLEKHIAPVAAKSNVKRNPLYLDIRPGVPEDDEKFKPSWTIMEYDTQTVHGNLADYLKEDEKTPKELDFWMEDIYTPGFDSLLKRKEVEQRRKKLCKMFLFMALSLCVCVVVITVPAVVLQNKSLINGTVLQQQHEHSSANASGRYRPPPALF